MPQDKYSSFEACLEANKDRKDPVSYCTSAVNVGQKKKGNNAIKMAQMMMEEKDE